MGNLGWSNPDIERALRAATKIRYVYPDYLYRPWVDLAELLEMDLNTAQVRAERLRAIYQFCNMHLTAATMEGDPKKIEDVIALLSDLRESWQQIAAAPPAAAAAA